VLKHYIINYRRIAAVITDGTKVAKSLGHSIWSCSIVERQWNCLEHHFSEIELSVKMRSSVQLDGKTL